MLGGLDARSGAMRLFTWAEWRARWRSHVALFGLVAATVAAVATALTGAARSEDAFAALRAATHAADAVLRPPDTEDDPADAIAAAARVEVVEAVRAEAMLFVRPAGSDYMPDFNLYPVAPMAAEGVAALDTPVITAGRPVDPGRADEVVVSEKLAADLGLAVGDVLSLESFTTEWVEIAFNGGEAGPPDGPRVDVEVVGLARTPADFGRWKGVMLLSPAFVARYAGQMRVYSFVSARLTPEATRQARDGGLQGLGNFEVDLSPFGENSGVDDGLGTIAATLRLVALAGAFAGSVATVLALARLTRVALGDRVTLSALGWTRQQRRGLRQRPLPPRRSPVSAPASS
jgi:hypothetical protein